MCDANTVKWNLDRQIGDNTTAGTPYAEEFYDGIVRCELPEAQRLVITLAEPNLAFIMYTTQRIYAYFDPSMRYS